MSKIKIGLSSLALVLGSVSLAGAQTFGTSTATSETLALITGVSTVIAGVVSAILALLAALIGLRWGVSKFKKWVAGRKF